MKEGAAGPQINMSKIRVGGGIAGAIFTVSSMLIFLIGIPEIRYLFPAAIVFGCGVALILHFIRHKPPGGLSLQHCPPPRLTSRRFVRIRH
jgi:hypothetical protein